MTMLIVDEISQSSDVLVNLKGVRGGGTTRRSSFMSFYVQTSRAERWEVLYLFREPARGDFIEPKSGYGAPQAPPGMQCVVPAPWFPSPPPESPPR
ncbi:hypothetical protein VTI74DRAFT_10896 [Chaetomium olivicolor]